MNVCLNFSTKKIQNISVKQTLVLCAKLLLLALFSLLLNQYKDQGEVLYLIEQDNMHTLEYMHIFILMLLCFARINCNLYWSQIQTKQNIVSISNEYENILIK